MDTGGLAQMTYNNHNGLGGGIGMPGSGYGSRGKGDNIRKLNVPNQNDNQPSQRTSRLDLLAGLRTAPKSAGLPTTAPPNRMEQPVQHGSHLSPLPQNFQQGPPKTATGTSFPGNHLRPNHTDNQFYSPDQILAPPAIQIGDESDGSQMDPRLYEELVRTNQYLAQQQRLLQEQLIQATKAAQQQFQTMNMGPGQQDGYMGNPMSFYNQQLQQGVQPVVNQVPGSPGVFTVFNPMTGQTSLAYDQHAQQQGFDHGASPTPTANNFRRRVSPPPHSPSPSNRVNNWRSGSPPKISTSPPRDDTVPLPPPSANAFRTTHRPNNLSALKPSGAGDGPNGIKTAPLRSTFPRTPMTGTFGPGQAQEGEHPVRQPRNPPSSIDDLVAKPTTKYEGSKNFVFRQRRGALKNLVRAGIERRGVRSSAQSSDSGSPTSDAPLSVTSEADDVSVRSGSASLEGRRDYNHPRSPNPGVIGSERKELKERSRERSCD